jgi:hypothetical protein
MTRTEAVLAAFARHPRITGAAELARILNLDADWKPSPCEWCPVGKPSPGNQCASVPERSRRRALRVLQRLVRAGELEHRYKGTVMSVYVRRTT